LSRATKSFNKTPICFTQLGYASPEGIEKFPEFMSWAKATTSALQAQWLADAVTLSAKSGKVRLLMVYYVSGTFGANDPIVAWSVIRPDGKCPACDSLSRVVPVIRTPVATANATRAR
jgi:hypothetical protein